MRFSHARGKLWRLYITPLLPKPATHPKKPYWRLWDREGDVACGVNDIALLPCRGISKITPMHHSILERDDDVVRLDVCVPWCVCHWNVRWLLVTHDQVTVQVCVAKSGEDEVFETLGDLAKPRVSGIFRAFGSTGSKVLNRIVGLVYFSQSLLDLQLLAYSECLCNVTKIHLGMDFIMPDRKQLRNRVFFVAARIDPSK